MGRRPVEGSWTAARLTQVEQWLVAGSAPVVLLDSSINGTPVQRWRHAATLHWQRQAWYWSADAQGIDSYGDESPDAQGATRRVARWWTVGLGAALRIGAQEWTLGVGNVFNRHPTFSNKTSSFAAGWDDLVHDPRGRSVRLAWKVSSL